MADDQVATKAPESDVLADDPHTATLDAEEPTGESSEQRSLIPGDTPAQTGLTMGDHCTTSQPLPPPLENATPAGELSTLNTISCYITKPADYPHNPGKLLIFLTGGTGVHSINNQLQADAYAERGFLVVMPDQFTGDPAPKTGTIDPNEGASTEGPSSPSIIERLKLGAVETAKSFLIDMWLARHTPEKVLPIIKKTLAGAAEEFADAVANGGGIYAVGYCFGAKYVLLLCTGDAEEKKEGGDSEDTVEKTAKEGEEVTISDKSPPKLKAGAIAHGTDITKDDIEQVRKPITMVCVEDDPLFPDDVREQGRASLELNAVKHEVKVFPGVPHGFAVLGDYQNQDIQDKQKEAFEMMSAWLEAH